MSGNEGDRRGPIGEVSSKDVYQELSKRFGGLRDTQYKLPGIFSALVGGLWYFAVQQLDKDRLIAAAVFLFAAATGLACITAMNRFRQAFDQYLDRINAFEGQHAVSVRDGKLSTNRAMVLLLSLSVFFSACGVAYSAIGSTSKAQTPGLCKIVSGSGAGTN